MPRARQACGRQRQRGIHEPGRREQRKKIIVVSVVTTLSCPNFVSFFVKQYIDPILQITDLGCQLFLQLFESRVLFMEQLFLLRKLSL